MKQAAAGDPQAFGRLVQAHQARMVRFATRLLGDRDAAEDAAQEAFLRLWRARERYEAQGAFDSFMLRILRNVCLDHLRRPKPPGSTGETPPEAAPAQQPAAGQPEASLAAAALGEAVRGAVQALPPPQREVFILSHYEGLSYQEIADVLGCPLGTVASRKHLAVEALRRRLAPWIEGEGR